MKNSRAPFVVAILLILPVLYVVSYFALLLEPGYPGLLLGGTNNARRKKTMYHYRISNEIGHRVFWPLEQIDRKVRRCAWERENP